MSHISKRLSNITFASAIAIVFTSQPARAAPIFAANSFFDLPTTGLPTLTTIDAPQSNDPAVPSWQASFTGSHPEAIGVTTGGQPGQLLGHHVAYLRNQSNDGGPALSQDVGTIEPNTMYTLTAGFASGPNSYLGEAEGGLYLYNVTSGLVLSYDTFIVSSTFADVTTHFKTGASETGDIGIYIDEALSGSNNELELYIQNIRLVDGTPVPEPSALAMLIAATGMTATVRLAARLRRSRRLVSRSIFGPL